MNDGIITSLSHLLRRNQVKWSIGPGDRLILDSGTDYALAGHSCLVIKRHKIFLPFGGAIPTDYTHYKELVDVITWVRTGDGREHLIKIISAADNTTNKLQETLLSPTHIRVAGHSVYDCHRHLGGKQSIFANNTELPLWSNGVHLFYKLRRPNKSDISKHAILFTGKNIWDPAREPLKAAQGKFHSQNICSKEGSPNTNFKPQKKI